MIDKDVFAHLSKYDQELLAKSPECISAFGGDGALADFEKAFGK